jgi:hypothetical protein
MEIAFAISNQHCWDSSMPFQEYRVAKLEWVVDAVSQCVPTMRENLNSVAGRR